MPEIFQVQQNYGEPLVFEIEREVLTKPLLSRVGILDINHIFNNVPKEVRSRFGVFPNIDYFELYPFLFELKREVGKALGVDVIYVSEENFEHWLYPILKGGLIADIVETRLFKRLYGIHQLGPNRNYPLQNDHNRAEHSIFMAIDNARTLQALSEKDKERLVLKLRNDFSKERISIDNLSDEEVLGKGLDLLVVCSLIHDLATPAGGDTFKYFAKLSEEDDLALLLSDKNTLLVEEKDKFLEILRRRGINEADLTYLLRCIQGKSETLIGEMIKPAKGDKLDPDRRAYTLLDGLAAGIFRHEIPTSLLPNDLSTRNRFRLISMLDSGIQPLLDPMVIATTGTYHLTDVVLPHNIIDCSEDFFLDEKGNLVCSSPEKLAWVGAYRVFMVGFHYAGFKLLGLEWELQQRLVQLANNDKVGNLLDKERLLSLTDEELYQSLQEIDDETLREILYRRENIGGTSLFEGKLADLESPADPEAFVSFPIKIKPGLESLVEIADRVITLKEYLESEFLNVDEGMHAAATIYSGLIHFENKRWDIYLLKRLI